MKIFKKIGLGLSLFVLLVSSVLAIGSGQALAAPVTENSFRNTTYIITSFKNNRPEKIVANIAGTTVTFTDSNTSDTKLNFKSLTGATASDNFICSQLDDDEGITLEDNPQPLPGGGTSRSGFIKLGYMDDTSETCRRKFTNEKYLDKLAILAVFGVPGVTPPGGSTGEADGGEADACQSNSGGWAFTWAVCPVLAAADELTTFLVNNFEEQLAFNVSQLGSATDKNSGSYKIHQTWSLIKNIASALVVIVMLIMVLSQAISVGPFDAYTVRKLLPRLVAVVILMQISWPLFTYVIDIVNNLGRGIADIMYLPFGGADNMDLWSLLNNAKLGDGTLAAMNWGALAVFAVLGVAFLFTMLGLAFMAIIALLFAVITLIFRKILIITLLIFAPLALLAWTLPGTEKYWKLWRENFLKVLMMFPIIMAIIAAGRIFAYVVGTPDTNKFMALLFILVGFFGPLFLLPRTFKWGGQAMNLAGDRIMGVGKNMGERQKKFMDTRQQGYSDERRRRSANRVAEGVGFNWKRPWHLPVDKVRSGQWDPTLTGRRSQRALAGYIKAGRETSRQEAEDFMTVINAHTEKMSKDETVNYLMQRFKDSKNGAEQHAIFQRLAQFKASRQIQQIRDDLSTNEGGRELWNTLSNGNYDSIKSIAPHLAAQFTDIRNPNSFVPADDLFQGTSDEILSGMTAHSWGEYVRSNPIAANAAYARVWNNDNLRGRLDPGSVRHFPGIAAVPGGATPPPATPAPGAPASPATATPPARVVPGGVAPQIHQQGNPGVFPSPGSTWRPTSGINTSVNASQGEINIRQQGQGGTPGTVGSPDGSPGNNPPGAEGPRETQNYTDFNNDDFGPDGRFPPPNIPPPSNTPPGPNNP